MDKLKVDNLVKIDRLNHTGEGIGLLKDKVIFIPKTLPGDIVLVSKVEDKRRYFRGEVLKYVSRSSEREKVICPYYDKCGGCQLMGLTYFKQLEYKKNKVIDIMKRYGEIDVLPNIVSTHQYNYRNKITLHIFKGEIGLYQDGSNDLVKIDECSLISREMNSIIKDISLNIDLKGVNKILIRSFNDKLMVKFSGYIDKDDVISKLKKKVSSIYLNDDLLWGDEKIEGSLGDKKYLISPNSFFQVNYEGAEKLYNKIREYLKKCQSRDKVLDLYCGTGSIGIFISDLCGEVVGIEKVSSSVNDAFDNIKLNNLDNVLVKLGDVSKTLNNHEKYDVVIVDPPRMGLDKKTINTLKNMKVPNIIYISCNPITLARDLKVLKDEYELLDISLFDLFPNTYHVETCVIMALRK